MPAAGLTQQVELNGEKSYKGKFSVKCLFCGVERMKPVYSLNLLDIAYLITISFFLSFLCVVFVPLGKVLQSDIYVHKTNNKQNLPTSFLGNLGLEKGLYGETFGGIILCVCSS